MATVNTSVPPEKRGIGYVPQEGTLFPHLTVKGNVRFGIPRKTDWQPSNAEVAKLTGNVIFVDGSIINGVSESALGKVVAYDSVALNMDRCLIMVRPEQLICA